MCSSDLLWALIKKIKSMGKTIVIAEHRIWYLMDVADRVIFMEKGRITSDMGIREFSNLSEKQIKLTELRCRNLSDVKAVRAGMNFAEPEAESNSSEMNPGGHILEVAGLTVRFGKRTVLNDVSFTANGGEIVAITGENGAGKTTLARTICGLIKEETGRISLYSDRKSVV